MSRWSVLRRTDGVIVAFLASVFLTAEVGVAGPPPRFELGFRECRDELDDPSHVLRRQVLCVLSTAENASGVGASGWSIGVAAEGARIVDIRTSGTVAADADARPPGLRSGGFERSELTVGAGNEGAVSIVVLSFELPVTLPVESVETIARFDVEFETPPVTSVATVRFAFVDGLATSTGDTIVNTVDHETGAVTPELGSCTIEVSAVERRERFALIFQDQRIDELRALSREVDVGRVTEIRRSVPAGLHGETEVFGAIVSDVVSHWPRGPAGWSIAAGVEGALDVVGATTRGTAAANTYDDPPGYVENTAIAEIIDPELIVWDSGAPQGRGFVSWAVLGFADSLPLPVPSTATVVRIRVRTQHPVSASDEAIGRLVWRDGLQGSGFPVSNQLVVGGETVLFTEREPVTIRFEASAPVFVRCDANGDGRNDLADPIRILSSLFTTVDLPECEAAGDCDADGRVAIDDAIFAIAHQFFGGRAPEAPFPDCGPAPSEIERCASSLPSCGR